MYFLAFAESIQLFPDGTLIIHIALILIMIWVLNRTFFKPINRIIEARSKFEGGRNTEAAEILRDVAEKEGTYNQELLEARTASYELVEKERAGALAERQRKISEAKAETARAISEQKRELQEQTAAARAEIEAQADALAEKISSNILRA